MNEDAHHILMVPQHVIRRSSHNDTASVFGNLFNDLMLRHHSQPHHPGTQIQIVQRLGRIFVQAGYKLSVQSALLGGKGGHLLIVKRDAQPLGQPSADLLSGGAVLPGNGNDHAGSGRLNDGRGMLPVHQRRVFYIGVGEKLPVIYNAQEAGQGLRDREGQPEPGKPQPGKDRSQRHKQHHRPHNGQKGAFYSRAHRLEKHREYRGCDQGKKADADKAESQLTDLHHPLIRRKHPEHGFRDQLKAKRSHRHEGHAEQHGGHQGHLAAVYPPGRVIETDDGHDTGLHGTEGDKEKGLPLIVQAQRRHGLIRKSRQNKIEPEDVKGVRGLHQDTGDPQAENLRHPCRIGTFGRRPPISLLHHNQSRHDLTGHCGHSGPRDPHFRQSEQSENQQRVQNDIGDRPQDLCQHGCFHVAAGLKDLRPDALKKQSEAEYTHTIRP